MKNIKKKISLITGGLFLLFVFASGGHYGCIRKEEQGYFINKEYNSIDLSAVGVEERKGISLFFL